MQTPFDVILSCTVKEPLVITPFHIVNDSNNIPLGYKFMGPCEYELVRVCDESVPFRVHVDFLSQDLSTGRVGVVVGEEGDSEDDLSRITIFENLTLSFENLEDVPFRGLLTKERNFSSRGIVIKSNGQDVFVNATRLGILVHVTRVEGQPLVVNVTLNREENVQPLPLCGLCGNAASKLVYRNSNKTADINNPDQVRTFIQTWKVLKEESFLREFNPDCGEYNNYHLITVILFVYTYNYISVSLGYVGTYRLQSVICI